MSAQTRANFIHKSGVVLRLITSVHESIALGDYAQALGNLHAAQDAMITLKIACKDQVQREHELP